MTSSPTTREDTPMTDTRTDIILPENFRPLTPRTAFLRGQTIITPHGTIETLPQLVTILGISTSDDTTLLIRMEDQPNTPIFSALPSWLALEPNNWTNTPHDIHDSTRTPDPDCDLCLLDFYGATLLPYTPGHHNHTLQFEPTPDCKQCQLLLHEITHPDNDDIHLPTTQWTSDPRPTTPKKEDTPIPQNTPIITDLYESPDSDTPTSLSELIHDFIRGENPTTQISISAHTLTRAYEISHLTLSLFQELEDDGLPTIQITRDNNYYKVTITNTF